MRHWLLNYFLHDFIPSLELRTVLTGFLNEMPFHPSIKQSPRDQRIIKGLKRVVRRLKKIYYASSSSATRVQVIGPPAPTFEQEKVAAMVKDKLSQSTIKQKTFNIVDRIHVDARHSGNTAIKDTNVAPVVIIGNYSTTNIPKRRGSSVASSSAIAASNRTSHHDTIASKEWSHVQRLVQSDYQVRNGSDNSLESALSPGTSEYDDMESIDDTFELDQSNAVSATQSSFVSKSQIKQQEQQPQITSDELALKLEALRLKQEEEDERHRAAFFLSSYSTNPAPCYCIISFYFQPHRYQTKIIL